MPTEEELTQQIISDLSGSAPRIAPRENPLVADIDAAVGRTEWRDQRYPVQERLSSAAHTHTLAGARDRRPFEEVAQNIQQHFPDQPNLNLDSLRTPYSQQLRMSQARHAYSSADPDVADLFIRHAIPFVSTFRRTADTQNYADATRRLQAGNPREGDYEEIARYERRQEAERGYNPVQSLALAVLDVPAMVGEAYLGGKALGMVGGLAGRTNAGAAAARFGAANPVLQTSGHILAQTAVMPSMYLPQAAEHALEHGGSWNEMRNLAPAYAVGVINTAVLGRLMSPNTGGIRGYLGRVAAGVGEQQVADIATRGLGLTTNYGALESILNGKTQDGLFHLATQALTFALFGALHAGTPGTSVLTEFRGAVNAYARRGLSREGAAREMAQATQPIVQDLRQNGEPTRPPVIDPRMPVEMQRYVATLHEMATEGAASVAERQRAAQPTPEAQGPPRPDLQRTESPMTPEQAAAALADETAKGPSRNRVEPRTRPENPLAPLPPMPKEPWKGTTQLGVASEAARRKAQEPTKTAPPATPEPQASQAPEAAPAKAREPFLGPLEIALDRLRAKLKQQGLSNEHVEKAVAAAREEGLHAPDMVTGFHKAEVREPTAQRAIEHVKDTGEPGVYVEMDLANLGGVNSKLGNSGANEFFRKVADIIREEMHGLPADAHLFRHGGDEMSALVVNANRAAVTAAMRRAHARIKDLAQQFGLSDIEHPKHPGVQEKRGTGVTFGVSEIKPNDTPKDLFGRADKEVEARKKSFAPKAEPVPEAKPVEPTPPEAVAPEPVKPAEPEPGKSAGIEQFIKDFPGLTPTERVALLARYLGGESGAAKGRELGLGRAALSKAHKTALEKMRKADPAMLAELQRGVFAQPEGEIERSSEGGRILEQGRQEGVRRGTPGAGEHAYESGEGRPPATPRLENIPPKTLKAFAKRVGESFESHHADPTSPELFLDVIKFSQFAKGRGLDTYQSMKKSLKDMHAELGEAGVRELIDQSEALYRGFIEEYAAAKRRSEQPPSLRDFISEGLQSPQEAPEANAAREGSPPGGTGPGTEGPAQTPGVGQTVEQANASAPTERRAAGGDELRREYTMKAVRAKIDPKQLHEAMSEMLADDARDRADVAGMLADLKRRFPVVRTVAARAAHGIDATMVRGLDDIAQYKIDPAYEGLFAGHATDRRQRLLDLIIKGPGKPMTPEQAYRAALDYLVERQPKPEELNSVNQERTEVGRRTITPEELQEAADAALEAQGSEGTQGVGGTEGTAQGERFPTGGRGESRFNEAGELLDESGNVLFRRGATGGGSLTPGLPGFPAAPTAGERQAGRFGGGQPEGGETAEPRRETALANAQVDREREARGLPPILSAMRRKNTAVWDAAMEMLGRDPQAGEKLVDELTRDPNKAINRVESALLLQRRVALTNERDRVVLESNAESRRPKAERDEAKIDRLDTQERALAAQMHQIDFVGNRAGSETGGTLQFRRQMAAEDYSLTRMLDQTERAKGKPLSAEEKIQIEDLWRKIKDLQDKLAGLEDAGKVKPGAPSDTGFDLVQAKARFAKMTEEFRYANAPWHVKALRLAAEAINLPRSIMSSIDFPLLRQGMVAMITHPIRTGKAVPEMFRSFFSEAVAERAQYELDHRPNAPLYEASGLDLTRRTGLPGAREEGFLSRLIEKVPLIGEIVKGSERSYQTVLNRIRADSFDAMVGSLSQNGKLTSADAKVIANYVNVMTGRGSLGPAQNASTLLSTVFFAPKWAVSRFQMLLGQPLYSNFSESAPRARALVAQEYARLAGGFGLMAGLAVLAGFKMEEDPRSAEFGKLKVGNTRLDLTGGLASTGRLLAQTMTLSTKNTRGQVVPISGVLAYGKDNYADVTARFLRGKLAPAPGAALNLLSGTDVVGQPATPATATGNLVTPLFAKDVYEAMLDLGFARGTAVSLLGLLGMGMNTYDPNAPRPQQTQPRQRMGLR